MTTSAFLGTNPTGELITAGSPVNREPTYEDIRDIGTEKGDSNFCAARAEVHDCGWTSYSPFCDFTCRGRPIIRKVIASIQRSGRLRFMNAATFAAAPIR
jgi:hypothetical protein